VEIPPAPSGLQFADCCDPAAIAGTVTGVARYERVIVQKRRKEGAEMNIAFLIGRIIFGGYWLMASFNHFKNLN
jgi:hypothetical protein